MLCGVATENGVAAQRRQRRVNSRHASSVQVKADRIPAHHGQVMPAPAGRAASAADRFVPAGPLASTKGFPPWSPITKETEPSRLLKITPEASASVGFNQIDQVIRPPAPQAKDGPPGIVMAAPPSSRRPRPIAAPSAGCPALKAWLPQLLESFGGCPLSAKW